MYQMCSENILNKNCFQNWTSEAYSTNIQRKPISGVNVIDPFFGRTGPLFGKYVYGFLENQCYGSFNASVNCCILCQKRHCFVIDPSPRPSCTFDGFR
jgi:hypothetical protein